MVLDILIKMEVFMKSINFFSNGSCKNHGCEAIYLSLMKIFDEYECNAYTEYYIDDIDIIRKRLNFVNIYKEKPKKLDTLLYKIKYKLRKNDIDYFKYKYKPFKNSLTKTNEIFLSIGGDNYCYGYNAWLEVLNNIVLEKSNKIILTGCSLEPESLDKEMIDILKEFTLIIARESITYKALLDKNFKNVYLVPDPAFVLPTGAVENANLFFNKETIGINISPLIIRNQKIMSNIYNLINGILENYDYNILFIPHVDMNNNSDYIVMNKIKEKYFADNKRIEIIKSNSATKIKGYISKCKILIAARTHASIAGYSNCIPTLVLGYSIKSKGIAKDIFGTDVNYVIPIEKISDEYDFFNGFKYIDNNYISIKDRLEMFIPNYKQRCYDIKKIIEDYIDE